jgi:hypothetical protein
MKNPEIDERIQATKRLLRESEALINHSISERKLDQDIGEKLYDNYETLCRLTAEVVTDLKH